ncbi:MAG: methyltransferase [Oligoflexia bacterium]|nr:methyltransferase [Oligoflexia bacterium]
MSLIVVSTPIGNQGDITLRAIESLQNADVIICEELRPAETLLKKLKIHDKKILQLNEHSKMSDVKELVGICKNQNCVLVSDCGTPGFCDPGAELVNLCVKENIKVDVNPGASSLMALISLSGLNLKEFYFVGFLPAENSERSKKITELLKIKVPLVVMDTPYRLNKTLLELAEHFGNSKAILGLNLTMPEEELHRGKLIDLSKKTYPKAPFVLIIS